MQYSGSVLVDGHPISAFRTKFIHNSSSNHDTYFHGQNLASVESILEHQEIHHTAAPDTHANKAVLGAVNELVVVDSVVSRRLVRKYDWRLLPLFTVINLFSFIDRVNIGNARLLGLAVDLHLNVGLRYNIALICFAIPTCFTDLPSGLACKWFGGNVWIPTLALSFGLVTMSSSLVGNYGGLYAARFVLGCIEGGLTPSIIWLAAQFYRRGEMGFRTSIYISASSASGAFSGLLSIALSEIPAWGLIHTWRNIYFFEGLMSCILGVTAYFLIPSGPENAKFLTLEEKVVAKDRLRLDFAGTAERYRMDAKHVKQALKSPHTLGCALGFLLINIVAQAFSFFTPTIIAAMGYSNVKAQLLSVGPYAATFLLSLMVGWLSDRYQRRGLVIVCAMPVEIAGFLMLIFLPASMPGAKYGAFFLVVPSIYMSLPIWLAWALGNSATSTVRSTASGVIVLGGSLGSLIAPFPQMPRRNPSVLAGTRHNSSDADLPCFPAVRIMDRKSRKGGTDIRRCIVQRRRRLLMVKKGGEHDELKELGVKVTARYLEYAGRARSNVVRITDFSGAAASYVLRRKLAQKIAIDCSVASMLIE